MLTETDVDLFRWLWMLRVMTLGQLRRAGYYQPDTGRVSSLDNVRKRLRRLSQKGFLESDRLLDTRERIYLLAEPALFPLRERYDIVQRRLYKPQGLGTLRQVHHALLVSECAVQVVEALRDSSLETLNLRPLGVPFYYTHAVANPRQKRHVERFVTQEDIAVPGRAAPLRIRPDLVFALAQGSVARLYFLEVDRGSEGVAQIAEKQLGYHHYFEAPDPASPERKLWQRYGAVHDYRVLLVTTEARRVTTLVQQLRLQPGFGLMNFSTVGERQEQERGENFVHDPIWTNQYGTQRSLAKR